MSPGRVAAPSSLPAQIARALERMAPQCAISSTRLRDALVRWTVPLRPPRNSAMAEPTTENASGKVTQAWSSSPSLTRRVVVSDFSCSSRLSSASSSARSFTTPSARRSSLMSLSVSTMPPSDRLSGLQLAIDRHVRAIRSGQAHFALVLAARGQGQLDGRRFARELGAPRILHRHDRIASPARRSCRRAVR